MPIFRQTKKKDKHPLQQVVAAEKPKRPWCGPSAYLVYSMEQMKLLKNSGNSNSKYIAE